MKQKNRVATNLADGQGDFSRREGRAERAFADGREVNGSEAGGEGLV
jgi:hypothetical protein